ncbi:site-specific DNA-methyltransferase [Psychrobacter sp. KCTC 72983]|uniref:site-specific DNA-methyltransferase n=1 Tax=Psychrobacter sp. KCTC 72983 TaxID=2733866 RepID=UPI0016470F9C|nr:site-specific DNA-methyltransferase [Psychrobacter sp. KCTC 72983]
MSEMEKITGNSPEAKSLDITQQNIEQLKQLFPDVFSENKIDFEALKAALGEEVDDSEERYNFTWKGKNKARQIAQTPSTGTLRPSKEESVNWDTTENLFIEGDNLEVLKLLQKSYHKKVKMIYIDPPYNTGNDFVYKDSFQDNLKNYLKTTGQLDNEGFKLSPNSDTSGRYHSAWLNMIYPRMKLARNLLKESGVLFMSIGQAELDNSVKVLDEIFGEDNRVSICTRLMKTGGQKGKFFSPNTDYVLVYAKNIEFLENFRGEISEELQDKVYNQIETEGERKGERYRSMGLFQPTLEKRPNQRYYIECPDGELVIPPGETFPHTKKDAEKILPVDGDGVWRWSCARYLEEISKGNILFKETSTSPLLTSSKSQSKWNIYTKIWLNERLESGSLPLDMFDKFENRHSSKELKALDIPFDFAKPTDLILYLMQIIDLNESDIVLDFFAGSATTAHSVMKFNSLTKDKKIRFFCIQLPERIDENSSIYKKGYKYITDIGISRIKKAATYIDNIQDNGFKIFRLDETNIRPWDADFDNLESVLRQATESIKENRSNEDVLYEIFLKYGYDLTTHVETEIINGKQVFVIGAGALIVCLDDGITSEVVEGIAKLKVELDTETTQVVFKDAGFADSNVKTNAIQILKQAGIDDVKSI